MTGIGTAEVTADGLSQRDFRRLAAYIEETAGIRMPPAKKTMVEGRLRRRLRALALDGFAAYCRYLFDDGGLGEESVHLIDAVTTNKTEFFREAEHFDFLARRLLPEMAGRGGRGVEAPFQVWSAASSVGAEAYSLAMLLADYAAELRNFHFSVLATDICTEVLERASAAVFPEDMVAPVPPDMRRRYLLRARDHDRREVRIVPGLRRLVSFAQLNLMDEHYPVPRDFDVIFCRNILIYFDRPTQEAVLRRLLGHLRRGGALFVGHSETVAGADLGLRSVACAVFVKE